MKNIKYTEPNGYFPKEIRDKYFGSKKPAAKKTAPAKKAAPKKKAK